MTCHCEVTPCLINQELGVKCDKLGTGTVFIDFLSEIQKSAQTTMLSADNVVIAPYQMEITIRDDSTKNSPFPLCIVTVVLFFSNLRQLALSMNQRKRY